MRLSVAIIAIALVLTPIAASVSTRPVHNTVYDTFVPGDPDETAEKRDATINCGDPAIPGQSDDSNVASGHAAPDIDQSESTFDASGENDALACWESADHDLWTESNGKVVGAAAPFYTCKAEKIDGSQFDIDVGLQNPFPLQETAGEPSEKGVLVATGSFYVIPEITGVDADAVEAVWFGFLETAPTVPGTAGTVNDEDIGGGNDALCAELTRQAHPASGAYYEFYRGDTDKSDGWTIPVNTLLVPDNVYGAYLKLLGDVDELNDQASVGSQEIEDDKLPQPSPGGLEVLGAGYVYATVDNDDADEQYTSCEPTRLSCDYQDITPPWPQIVPGDVPLDQVEDKSTLRITFGEHVQVDSLTPAITVNGVTQNVGPTNHDSSDVDSAPLFTATEDKWGEEWEINVPGGLQAGDEISVSAMDLHGNQATKTVTLGQ